MNLFGKDKRPVWNNELKLILLKQIAKEISKWNNSISYEEALEDCEKVFQLNDSCSGEAYDLARDFEDDCGYHPDMLFLDIMESVWSIKYNLLYEKISDWIKSDQISLEKSLNDNVKIKLKSDDKIYSGKIIRIDEKRGTYSVNVPEKNDSETSGYVINFEDIIE